MIWIIWTLVFVWIGAQFSFFFRKVDIGFKDQISLSQTFQACWKIWDVMFATTLPTLHSAVVRDREQASLNVHEVTQTEIQIGLVVP